MLKHIMKRSINSTSTLYNQNKFNAVAGIPLIPSKTWVDGKFQVDCLHGYLIKWSNNSMHIHKQAVNEKKNHMVMFLK